MTDGQSMYGDARTVTCDDGYNPFRADQTTGTGGETSGRLDGGQNAAGPPGRPDEGTDRRSHTLVYRTAGVGR